MLVGIAFNLLIALGLNGEFQLNTCLLNNLPWLWTWSACLAVRLPILTFNLMCLFLVSTWRCERPACSCFDAFHAVNGSTSIISNFFTIFSIYLSFTFFIAFVMLVQSWLTAIIVVVVVLGCSRCNFCSLIFLIKIIVIKELLSWSNHAILMRIGGWWWNWFGWGVCYCLMLQMWLLGCCIRRWWWCNQKVSSWCIWGLNGWRGGWSGVFGAWFGWF